jgi:hypothetical protein
MHAGEFTVPLILLFADIQLVRHTGKRAEQGLVGLCYPEAAVVTPPSLH